MTLKDAIWILQLIRDRDTKTDAEKDAMDFAIDYLQNVPAQTAELVRSFHDRMLDRYNVTDDQIVKLLERTKWRWLPDEMPKQGQDVLLEYSTKAGDIRRCVARWTGECWSGHPHNPLRWMFLPE